MSIARISPIVTMMNVLELAGNLSNGVPIATPVFDGATENEINEHAREAGLDDLGSGPAC